ncbi:uncharacterized protein L969DRAFT_96226 [Mixia osmundae IAM 14324]|uniref:uncharacterized protein n=1 Tax=Mixia osmundae (strain CBS 9802 / IAM 14324 / JCM 22182 / KY 12970) TaxID=764103 RepID=UPI0004A548C0|nr:uncharacterized protein L969DRAFT_96226 [Mixia osmundae IAM 14324]KEI37707.1 hypothetical protein L969DRAFT_96226 [Mixia osmundae IAM 14324]
MSGKVVLVTGSSEGGIGNACCISFHNAGCKVYASARRLESLASLPDSIEKIQLDVLDKEACQKAIEHIISKEGRIDVLVNNAGAGATGALLDFDLDQAESVYKANVFAPMRLCQLVAPHMVKQREGLIINICSIVGIIGTPWAGWYSSSKAALISLSDVLRMEVQGFGIKVMTVCPGAVRSGFGDKQAASLKTPDGSLYANVNKFIQERAQMGQQGAMPNAEFANKLVASALKTSPSAYFLAGGRAFQFQLMSFLPRWFVWRTLMKRMGCYKVGLSSTRRHAGSDCECIGHHSRRSQNSLASTALILTAEGDDSRCCAAQTFRSERDTDPARPRQACPSQEVPTKVTRQRDSKIQTDDRTIARQYEPIRYGRYSGEHKRTSSRSSSTDSSSSRRSEQTAQTPSSAATSTSALSSPVTTCSFVESRSDLTEDDSPSFKMTLQAADETDARIVSEPPSVVESSSSSSLSRASSLKWLKMKAGGIIQLSDFRQKDLARRDSWD